MLLRLLDQLSASGGQIVLASDRPPSEIDGLDERLVTRFSGGLIVDIGVPEYETKVAILRKKAEERGQTFEAGVAEALAKYSFKSVRELAGALNKVLAIQELEGRQVTVEEIKAMPGLHQTGPASEGSIAGQQLLDEFGSFMEELSQTVATKVEREEAPWRRLLRETAETFEKDGYSGTRLRSLLESDESPPDPQAVADEFRRDVTRLRQIAKSLDRVGNPWPEAAVGLLKDPERLDEAESLLASALERVRPFPLIGEGTPLGGSDGPLPAVALKAAEQLVTEERPEYNPLFVWSPQPDGPLALLAATARSFREHDKLSNVAIVSDQEFSEDFIRDLSEGVAGAWRERWWGVDLLLVYDAQDTLRHRAGSGRVLPPVRGVQAEGSQDPHYGGSGALGDQRYRRSPELPLRDGSRCGCDGRVATARSGNAEPRGGTAGVHPGRGPVVRGHSVEGRRCGRAPPRGARRG